MADALGHARSAMSDWLNAKPPIDVAVANEICDYIGSDIRVVIRRTEQRMTESLALSSLTVDSLRLSEDKKAAYVLGHSQDGRPSTGSTPTLLEQALRSAPGTPYKA